MDDMKQSVKIEYEPPELDKATIMNQSVVVEKGAANKSIALDSSLPIQSNLGTQSVFVGSESPKETTTAPKTDALRVFSNESALSNSNNSAAKSFSAGYTSLRDKGDVRRITPFHRGKMRSLYSLASDLDAFTRFPSNGTITKYDDVAALVSTYTSYVPRTETAGLLQIEYELHQQTSGTSTRSLYWLCLALFAVSYVLLFIPSTADVARYLVLCIALALSLIFTMMPSFIPIPVHCQADGQSMRDSNSVNLKAKIIRFPLDQSTVPVLCVLILCISGDDNFSWDSAWQSMKGSDIR